MDTALQAVLNAAEQEANWEADEDGEYDEDEEYDDEAQEMAKRLGDQLWADIAKAQAEATASVPAPPPPSAPTQPSAGPSKPTPQQHTPHTTDDPLPPHNRKQDAALVTVRTILSFAFKDPVVRATLATHSIPPLGSSVLDILTQCAASGNITKAVAAPLSAAVVLLAKSDVLFEAMRNSDAPAKAMQLDRGKRKRDQLDEDPGAMVVGDEDDRAPKRPAVGGPPHVLELLTHAVNAVIASFAAQQPWRNGAPDPAFITSIQSALHQVYLFSVTSIPRAKPEHVHALQELAALIQMLGVLSKTPIGPAPTPWDVPDPSASSAGPTTDIGTAVYPCMVPGCTKTFHRLYSLRTHERLHALVDRPYKCTTCPASFARNHDLKRHVKLHDRTAWRCGGCAKVFSRRDAIKRHKDSRGRTGAGGSAGGAGGGGKDAACATAEIEQVEVDRAEDEEDVSRRAKMWNGIVATQIANATALAAAAGAIEVDGTSTSTSTVPLVHVETMNPAGGPPDMMRAIEEGEIPQHVIEHGQAVVLQLYPVIKSRIGPSEAAHVHSVGAPPGHQSTLASVIARTQAHFQPPSASASTGAEPSASAQPSPAQHEQTDTPMTLSWLTEEQTRLLEEAIAQAASAAQAQAEAEAALEADDDDDDDIGEEEDYDEMDTTGT
ncbi:hypothetical protein BDW22DRAFT_1380144 [Trametopsis cervina]|nr:hypothetical protein BDW22DRAFT_1380144 [Trametopsis cervina]